MEKEKDNNLQNHIISYLISQSPKIQSILKDSEKINEYGLDLVNTMNEIRDLIACSAIISNNSTMIDEMNPQSHIGRIKAKRVLLSFVNKAYSKYCDDPTN